MRFFRTFLVLLGERLKLRSFIVFIVVVALVGPVFIVLNSVTHLESRESRPLLSEKTSVNHFNIRGNGMALPGSESAIALFRDSANELAPWSIPGRIFDFYRTLFPLLMVAMGIVALPSRRKLALLHIALPWGRWGCFILTAGVLVFQVSLLIIASGAATGLSLIATQGRALATAGFVATYFSAVLIYGLGFALLGFVLSELVRNRPIALLVGLALIIGVWVFVSPLPAQGFSALIKSITGRLPYQSQDSTIRLAWLVLRSPFDALTSVLRSAGTSGWLFIGLGLFAGFWLFVSWIAFPRTARYL